MMTQKLRSIMLIDDNRDDNYFHERIIKKKDSNITLIVHQSALDALDYLKSLKKDNKTPPDLIFLDINMPKMNGWEFLEEYDKMDGDLQSKVVVVLLSTSDNPDDLERAKKLTPKPLKDYRTKPLTLEILEDIIAKYFN
ncbi:MAG: response regulator [Bacteroidetes bacterium]|nr:response regulator [Bacteroidota bacterium]